jgi:hypothetical protein
MYWTQRFVKFKLQAQEREGIGRFPSKEEYKNQRILIQIVPKIGEIKIE